MQRFRKPRSLIRIALCAPLAAGIFLSCERPPNAAQRANSASVDVKVVRSFEVMGTLARLTAIADRRESADAALEAGRQALHEVNRLMSDYLDESEIGRLNRASAGEMIALSPTTWHCLRKSLEISAQSEGAFDVTCRPLIRLWREAAREQRLPTEKEFNAVRTLIGPDKLMLDEAARSVARRLDGVQVDLGGIAKGYALDLAVEAMQAAGARGGLADVGGDVVAFGKRENGQPWRVGVRDPFAADAGAYRFKLQFDAAAVATSGVQERFFEIVGRRYSHILDPRTGQPAEQAPSVTVIAADGLTADAWATALSVLSITEGKRLLARKDASAIEVLWIAGSADAPTIEMTEGFKRYICP